MDHHSLPCPRSLGSSHTTQGCPGLQTWWLVLDVGKTVWKQIYSERCKGTNNCRIDWRLASPLLGSKVLVDTAFLTQEPEGEGGESQALWLGDEKLFSECLLRRKRWYFSPKWHLIFSFYWIYLFVCFWDQTRLVCVCVGGGLLCFRKHVCRSEDNLPGLVFSYHGGSQVEFRSSGMVASAFMWWAISTASKPLWALNLVTQHHWTLISFTQELQSWRVKVLKGGEPKERPAWLTHLSCSQGTSPLPWLTVKWAKNTLLRCSSGDTASWRLPSLWPAAWLQQAHFCHYCL